MNDIDSRIRDRVQSFVDELSDLVRQSVLESVQSAFGTNGARSVRRGPGRPPKARAAGAPSRRAKGAKRSPAEIQQLQDRLLSAIKSKPGQRKEQLAKAINASTKDLMLVTNKLLDAGSIRKKGVKRATTYFAR